MADKDKDSFSIVETLLEKQIKVLEEGNKLYRQILLALEDRKEEEVFSKQVIQANSYIESKDINDEAFERARIFCNVEFTQAQTGGITVYLYYGTHKLGEVMKVESSTGSAMAASEPIDICELGRFKFLVKNNDGSNNATVNYFRIVKYNEW